MTKADLARQRALWKLLKRCAHCGGPLYLSSTSCCREHLHLYRSFMRRHTHSGDGAVTGRGRPSVEVVANRGIVEEVS